MPDLRRRQAVRLRRVACLGLAIITLSFLFFAPVEIVLPFIILALVLVPYFESLPLPARQSPAFGLPLRAAARSPPAA